MPRMLDFESMIRQFAPQAVKNYVAYDLERDKDALDSLKSADASTREGGVRKWLEGYKVLMGFTTEQRNNIAHAVVKNADERDANRDIDSIESLSQIHAEVMRACTNGLGKERDFTSLASKALWLYYPDKVPLFDSLAHRALCVLSKLDDVPQQTTEDASKYESFIFVWKTLYTRYSPVFESLDLQPCQYTVRVFDGILMCIGKDRYWMEAEQ
jgi:hypothetical protein